jgi:hypothetical protein
MLELITPTALRRIPHTFFQTKPPLPVPVVTHRDRVGGAYPYHNSMKNFTEEINRLEFLNWVQQQKYQGHETDEQIRQQNSRKGNASVISKKAAFIRAITTAKA